MKSNSYIYIFLIVGALTINSLVAQVPTKLLEIATSLNAYKGDLGLPYSKWASSFYLGLRMNKNDIGNFYVNISIGNVIGQQINYMPPRGKQGTPNTFFKTDMIIVNAGLQFNLITQKRFVLYLSQGIGLLRYSPRDSEMKDLIDQQNTREKNEIYTNNTIILPTKLGVMYYFKSGFGVGNEIGFMNPRTDYIDNISALANPNKDNILTWRFSFYTPLAFNRKKRLK